MLTTGLSAAENTRFGRGALGVQPSYTEPGSARRGTRTTGKCVNETELISLIGLRILDWLHRLRVYKLFKI